MRLDRILIRYNDNKVYNAVSIDMFATEPVYDILKKPSLLEDSCAAPSLEAKCAPIVENVVGEIKPNSDTINPFELEKHEYLYPSDHFGLLCVFEMAK